MSDGRHLEVLPDADALAATVADAALTVLRDALAVRPAAHLVVTAGSILEAVQLAMARPDALDWSRVHVWWGDERYVPADDADRNDLPAALASLPLVAHRIAASDGPYPEAETAAAAYAGELAQWAADGADTPAFDVGLIGVGPDGHCCSLFPHHPVLAVRDRPVSAVHDSPKPPPDRLTLTFPALAAVRELWFVASGDGKADAVAAALTGSPTEETPSGAARGSEQTIWWVDRAAGSHLPSG